ncbi:DoxX family protein, partial [Bacteroidota bacterium]
MKTVIDLKGNVLSLVLLTLRTFIGWHFLYEGIVKLASPTWSAHDYLLNSKWIFSGFFIWI